MNKMIRLIDANELLEHTTYGEWNGLYISSDYVKTEHIRKAKTYEQRLIGHWEWDENGLDWGLGAYRCSECRQNNLNLPTEQGVDPYMFASSHFCSCCGAQMERN